MAIALKSLGLSANLGADQLLNPNPQHAGFKSSGSDGATSGQLPEGSLAEAVQRRLAELRGCALLYSNRDHIRALQSGGCTQAMWGKGCQAGGSVGVCERKGRPLHYGERTQQEGFGLRLLGHAPRAGQEEHAKGSWRQQWCSLERLGHIMV